MTAWRWWRDGKLPVPAYQTPSGSVLVSLLEHRGGRTAVYARVAVHAQTKDLDHAGLGALRRQLRYKCPWYGSRLIEADTFFPSSKLCSRCGTAKATLALSERTFHCEHCGAVVDRDLNAAANLAALVAAAGSGPEALDARGRDVRLDPVELSRMTREAGSGWPHQTGTLMPQGVSA